MATPLTPLSLYDLLDRLPKPGCAVCALLRRDAERFLDTLLYEFVIDVDSQQEFRDRRGLCNEHGWTLLRLSGGSLGTAILYRAALDEALQTIARTPVRSDVRSGLARRLGKAGSALAQKLKADGRCAACEHLDGAETMYIQTIGQYLGDERLMAAFRDSSGLCLPHFRRLLEAASDAAGIEDFVAVQRAIWERLKADLEEFIDKNRHERSREPMGTEGDSWRRVIDALGGGPGVFGADRRTT
ncbi:MAG: hypothetical protein IT323_11700 [Anaerolineae bacterium]|nr:hypothetical protein [Anaerolineae bacterium]